MTKSFLKSFLFAATTCTLLGAYATPPTTMPVRISLQNGEFKIVQLMQMPLSAADRKALLLNITNALQHPSRPLLKSSVYPVSKENGMNNIPVLDQGAWGTCVTFAATAAIDALLSLQGQQSISQLCNLELGRTLRIPDSDGGWEGSFAYLVLGQIQKYGYLPLQYQLTTGCGGLTNYPIDDPIHNGSSMTLASFSAHSVMNFKSTNWHPLLSFNGSIRPISPVLGDTVLTNVKKALVNNHRVVFGTLLDPYVGNAGAIGEYNNKKLDTWVLTPEIKSDIQLDSARNEAAGHEMVIIGYNDQACSNYNDVGGTTKQQCGILHLRNSWSNLAGDNGDFYVTYDYFKTMTIEAYEIGGN